MLTEDGEWSRSHGLRRSVLAAQAAALGVPLVTGAASWTDYTTVFIEQLAGHSGDATACVFGDIDIDNHRRWCERATQAAGLAARHPSGSGRDENCSTSCWHGGGARRS